MGHYLLVEGVNIYDNVFDTNQLSIVRGGSFLLKQAIADIAEGCAGRLEPLSIGASSGFFLVKQDAPGDSGKICADIVEYLESNELYSLLTFIVETCEEDSPVTAKRRLLAKLRFHQLQAPSLVPDCVTDQSPGPSEWSGVRARTNEDDKVTYGPSTNPDKEVKISRSEKKRWKYGRGKKQSYYLEEVVRLGQEGGNPHQALIEQLVSGGEEGKGYRFTRDLHELSECGRYPDLSGKIAIFYADGNGFGALQRKLVDQAGRGKSGREKSAAEAGAQKKFDSELQTLRQRFLAELLQESLPGGRFPEMQTTTRTDDNKYVPALRLETLLWGGDEMLFVMPAWIGFDFVQFFFQQTRGWKIQGQPLTHSAGLVLCSAKTPIRITRKLAQVIADYIKDETAKTGEGKRNAWDYMVLESIDYPAHFDFGRFLGERYGPAAAARSLCIEPGQNWAAEKGGIVGLLENQLPGRQLHGLAHWLAGQDLGWLGGINAAWPPPDEPDDPMQQRERRLLAVCEKIDDVEEGIRQAARLFGLDEARLEQRAWLWLHLAELRNYIAPRRKEP
ncbi:hypothetical protein [Thiolapillus sp.]